MTSSSFYGMMGILGPGEGREKTLCFVNKMILSRHRYSFAYNWSSSVPHWHCTDCTVKSNVEMSQIQMLNCSIISREDSIIGL